MRRALLFLALALATLMSLAALRSRTPPVPDKVMLSFAVALILGVLVPRLVAA